MHSGGEQQYVGTGKLLKIRPNGLKTSNVQELWKSFRLSRVKILALATFATTYSFFGNVSKKRSTRFTHDTDIDQLIRRKARKSFLVWSQISPFVAF